MGRTHQQWTCIVETPKEHHQVGVSKVENFPLDIRGPALCQVEKYLSVRLTTKLCDVNSVRTASTRCVLVYHSVSSQCTAFYILFVDSFRGAEECSHLGGGWEGLGKGISF